jgi:hypothetical protein
MKKTITAVAMATTFATTAFAHQTTPTFHGEFFKLTQMHSVSVENAEFAKRKYTNSPFSPEYQPVTDILEVDYTIHPITCSELMARKGYLVTVSPKYKNVTEDINTGKKITLWSKSNNVVACRDAKPLQNNYKVTVVIFDKEILDHAINQTHVNLQSGYSVQNNNNLDLLGKL